MKKKIEDIYKELDELDHILLRPGMYIGSTKLTHTTAYTWVNNKIVQSEISYVPGVLKIIDEVISNSCDEYRRTSNMGLNKINVSIDLKTNKVTVEDNGGIAVQKHSTAGCYLPEFIFGRLRTSSNYDDDESRNVVGTNGVGASLANIFSKEFVIECADGKKEYHRTWKNNMRQLCDDLKVKPSKKHYMRTIFVIDDSRFEDFSIKDVVPLIIKRCADAAAANPGLEVSYNDTTGHHKFKFSSFDDYVKLYNIDPKSKIVCYKDTIKEYVILPTDDKQVVVGFVNGVECSRGTHIQSIKSVLNKAIQEFLLKKKKIQTTLQSIDAQYSLFCNFTVYNPTYDSQTKECLTNNLSKDPNYELSQDTINKVLKSEIIDNILDWYAKKEQAEDAKKLRKLNKDAGKLLRNDKFINCNSKKTADNELWIFEGDSAASGFRAGRNPDNQAGYLMRGVPLNTYGLKPTKVMTNQVFNDIVKVIGLQWGKYNNKKDLKFSRIVISTDMDYDGDKIASLLLVFFNHFPELFEQKLICRVISPIIIASSKKDTYNFYTLDEFRDFQKKYPSKLKGCDIKHIKGLGGQNTAQYKEMMRSKNYLYFTKDDAADAAITLWFDKDNISDRRSASI